MLMYMKTSVWKMMTGELTTRDSLGRMSMNCNGLWTCMFPIEKYSVRENCDVFSRLKMVPLKIGKLIELCYWKSKMRIYSMPGLID